MGKYWRLIGHYAGEAQTYEALAGAFQASPYRVPENCTLKGLRVIVSAEAASTLTEGVQFRLTNVNWKPNEIHIIAQGNGLRTAPGTTPPALDYEVNQPCSVGTDITSEGRNNVATAITNNIFIMGLFES
jgi:hypothetical protein